MYELEQFASIKSVHSTRTVELSVVTKYRLHRSSLPRLNNGHTPLGHVRIQIGQSTSSWSLLRTTSHLRNYWNIVLCV